MNYHKTFLAVATAFAVLGSMPMVTEAGVPNYAAQRAASESSASALHDYVPSGNFATGVKYTGLIVDCRGLGLVRSMSPVVKTPDGLAVYGNKIKDYDAITKYGAADFALDPIRIQRAGNTPLVIKAVGLTNDNKYPTISTEDADKVLAADKLTQFLEATNVVFLQ